METVTVLEEQGALQGLLVHRAVSHEMDHMRRPIAQLGAQRRERCMLEHLHLDPRRILHGTADTFHLPTKVEMRQVSGAGSDQEHAQSRAAGGRGTPMWNIDMTDDGAQRIQGEEYTVFRATEQLPRQGMKESARRIVETNLQPNPEPIPFTTNLPPAPLVQAVHTPGEKSTEEVSADLRGSGRTTGFLNLQVPGASETDSPPMASQHL